MRIVILLVMFLICRQSSAQGFEFAARLGYGTYSMEGMKTMQKTFTTSIPGIPLKVTEQFPPFFYYGLQLQKIVKPSFALGMFVEYKSTGGRVNYADYSGSVSFNQELQDWSFGAVVSSSVWESGKNKIPFFLKASYGFTKLDIKSEGTSTSSNPTSQTLTFNSGGINLEPGIGYRRTLGKFFVEANIGAAINFYGKLRYSTDTSAYLIDRQNQPIKPEWAGLRTSLSAGIRW